MPPIVHALASNLTDPQPEGAAVAKRQVSYRNHTKAILTGDTSNAKGFGGVESGRRRPHLSQTERVMQQTLSDRKEDVEEVDAVISERHRR